MDEMVERAMTRWPDVPDCYGWLRLDARGCWRVGDGRGRFDPVTHRGLAAFLGRNYFRDTRGRCYVQNGPQRVWVALELTPYVYRVSDDKIGLVSHDTGAPVRDVKRLVIDSEGALVLDAQPGVGVLLDRDLLGFVEQLQTAQGRSVDLQALWEGALGSVLFQGQALPVTRAARADLPGLLGYNPDPQPTDRH